MCTVPVSWPFNETCWQCLCTRFRCNIFVWPGWAGPPRSLNRHRRDCGCCIQRLRLNEFTKTKRWRNCKNGLAKVKIIVNWSVWKKKLLKIIIRKASREWECHCGTLFSNKPGLMNSICQDATSYIFFYMVFLLYTLKSV